MSGTSFFGDLVNRHAPAGRIAGFCQAGVGLVAVLQQYAVPAQRRCHFMIIAAREHGADIIIEHLDLLASDLCPARIVADDRDHRDIVTHERIELGERIADGAIAKHGPDVVIRPAQAIRLKRRQQVAAVCDDHAVIRQLCIDRPQQLDRVNEFAGFFRGPVDFGLALGIPGK